MIEPGALTGTLRKAYVIWLKIPKEKPLCMAKSLSEYDIKIFLVQLKVFD
jgi:hypothetical protein